MNIKIDKRRPDEELWIKYMVVTGAYYDEEKPRISFREWKIKENFKMIKNLQI